MVTLDDIRQARTVLDGVAEHTRLIYSHTLSRMLGGHIYLKPELFQHTERPVDRRGVHARETFADASRDVLRSGVVSGAFERLEDDAALRRQAMAPRAEQIHELLRGHRASVSQSRVIRNNLLLQ